MNRELLLNIFSENKRMLIIASALALVSFVLCYINIGVSSKLAEVQAKYEYKRLAVLAESPVDVATAYRQGGEGIKFVKSRIPASSDFPVILGQLVDLAASNKVSLGTISYKPQKAVISGISTYSLRSSAIGKYASIKRFIAELQGLHGMAIVESVVLANNDPYESIANLDFELSIHLRELSK